MKWFITAWITNIKPCLITQTRNICRYQKVNLHYSQNKQKYWNFKAELSVMLLYYTVKCSVKRISTALPTYKLSLNKLIK